MNCALIIMRGSCAVWGHSDFPSCNLHLPCSSTSSSPDSVDCKIQFIILSEVADGSCHAPRIPLAQSDLALPRLATGAGPRSTSAMSCTHAPIARVSHCVLVLGYELMVKESHLDCVYQGNYRQLENSRSARYHSGLTTSTCTRLTAAAMSRTWRRKSKNSVPNYRQLNPNSRPANWSLRISTQRRARCQPTDQLTDRH